MRLNEKDKIKFVGECDPFNSENILDGVILRGDIGSMIITKVNGVRTNQMIYCTPKFKYPFDFNKKFHFPPKIKMVESFEKYDGTNIVQYTYNDSKNKTFVSYKTRQTMFPNEIYTSLLKKIINKYPTISELPFKNYCNLSYELYGYLNPITIIYDTDINIVLLFGIKKNEQSYISPTFLQSENIKKASLENKIDFETKEDLEENYNAEREKYEKNLVRIDDNNHFKGKEGAVWYCHFDHYTQMYKLKPPTIEKICWTFQGKFSRMGKIAIRNTLINAMEDFYPISFEDIKPYLLEEYSIEEINVYAKYILQEIPKINSEREFELKIIKDYKENNLDIVNGRGFCMNWFAKEYGKENSTDAYNVIKKYFI